MAKEDEDKTTFITSQGVFCYSKTPFGLRNARATCQRLVDKASHKQIGRNLEVYVDDLVIKSRREDEIIRHIEETFKTLREINMKLNPKKCTFGVEEGMFLGYKVNTKGIKACLDKVDAVLSLPSPKYLKDVQKLNGKLASLNKFLAKSAEKSLPFFKSLKKCTKKSNFHWTEEAEAAFKQMKQLIEELPTLTAPEEKEELIVYLATAKEAVSAVLMTEREAKKMPIYFISRALRGPEVNYTSMENLVLALVHASKRLKRYFQEHPIIVVTDQPIKQVLSKPEVAGMLQKWSIELGEYVKRIENEAKTVVTRGASNDWCQMCRYEVRGGRASVRGTVAVRGVSTRQYELGFTGRTKAQWKAGKLEQEEDDLDTAMEVEEELSEPWILFSDGSSCVDDFGARLILTNPEGAEFTYALRFRLEATNIKAKYEALIAGLRIAEEMGVKNLQENVDSRLVANQVNGTYIEKEADMIQYLEKVRTLTNGFRMFSIKQVLRSKNKKADALSKITSTSFAHLSKQVLVKELKDKSINELEVLAVVEEEGNTWMTLIYEYLTEETLSAIKKFHTKFVQMFVQNRISSRCYIIIIGRYDVIFLRGQRLQHAILYRNIIFQILFNFQTHHEQSKAAYTVALLVQEEKQNRRNEMKARGTLLMALPNKDQLKFHSYKDAKLLMEAIEKRYRGNKESKKVQRTLLTQQYENFAGSSSKTMDQTFDRLQKLISQLDIQGEVITQEDINLKLLRSLPSEWETHALIWKNKEEIETISLDELYKNLKIYDPELAGSSSISQNLQNVAFVSSNNTNSNSSTNEADNTAYGVSPAHTQCNPISKDNLSDVMIYAFLASQPNSPQLAREDLEQTDPNDLEEMDLQWEMTILTIRARRFIQRTSRKLDVNG
ncbi:reverse transcriptase domain-containing protein [Tanacetum coccineum]